MFASSQEGVKDNEKASPPIGLQVGDKAPVFILRDQFNRTQSNETLKGSNGTVLLFFRSADW
jgi:hypothetical protein